MLELAIIENALKPMEPMFLQVMAPLARFGVEPLRIMRSVVISCERSPQLLRCELPSILQAAMTGAMLGLEADGVTGQGFLIPFKRRAQWVTGYKGYNTLAARVGLTLNSGVVQEGDAFDYEEGSYGYVRQKRLLNKPDRRIIAAWATATAPGRTSIVKVMDLDELEAIRSRSRAAARDDGGDDEKFSPWSDAKIGRPAMYAKTAKRRLQRDLPLSSFTVASVIDEAHEERGRSAYMDPDRGIIIDGKLAPPLVVDAETRRTPTLETVQGPTFLIKGSRGDIRLQTIEQWRGRWMEEIPKLSASAAQTLYDLNVMIFDDYRDRHPSVVNEVAGLLQTRFRNTL